MDCAASALHGSRVITADIHQPGEIASALQDMHFDVVVDWIAYTPQDIERDLELFRGRVGQFIFISSASAYQKPPDHYLITEIDAAVQSLLGLLAQQDRLRGAADARIR